MSLTSTPGGAPLNSAPIQALSSSQNPNSLQALTPSQGTLTPIIMDSSVLSQGQAGTIVTLPQSFCFPNTGFNAGNISQGMALPSSSVPAGSSTQLSALSMGSVFSINPSVLPPQLMHSLTVPQQQALTMSLNQASPQQPQNLQPLAIGQNSGNVGAGSSAIPLNQMVGSSMTPPGISFVNQALFTMPNPSNGQPQFIPQPFGQIPIMLGGQPTVLTNNTNQLTPQALASSSMSSQSASVFMASSQSVQSVTIPSTTTPNSNTKPVFVTSSNIPPTLKSTSVETTVVKSLPDTAKNATPVKKQEVIAVRPTTNAESIVSSTTGSAAVSSQSSTQPLTVVTSSATSSDDTPVCPSHLPNVSGSRGSAEVPPESQTQSNVNTVCARMKFTPIEPDTLGSLDHKRKLLFNEEFDDNEESDNVDEEDGDSNLSGPLERDERESPVSLSVTEVKIEPFERNSGDECKRSPSLGDCSGDMIRKVDTQGDLADIEDLDDTEFVWEDYLRETGASAVPPTAFKHVELSLQSGFCKGMKLEAPNKNSPNTYWLATVVMTCGPLLRLRFEGYKDNSSADFWSDPMTSDIHPVGWCEKNGKVMHPPDFVKEKSSSWTELLKKALENAMLAPTYLLDKTTGATPVDQIQEGMRLEIQHDLWPNHVWIVRIMENVGGRLCLRYEGLESSSHDFWLFYLDEHLHPLGWCRMANYDYVIPEEVKSGCGEAEETLMKMVDSAISNVGSQRLLVDIFQDQRPVQSHKFKAGMKLETVDPVSLTNICPATVIDVINDKYFIVQIDSVTPLPEQSVKHICCHGGSFNIFPINWAASMGIKLATPHGWEGQDFNWDQYLEFCKASAAPEDLFHMENEEHEFECGMKLEVTNPHQPHQICAATITKVVGPLLWVHLDSSRKVMDSHVESVHSLNLFPISWCFGNGFQLQAPRKTFSGSSRKRIAVVQPEMADDRKADIGPQTASGDRELYGGPQIYFNHRCFSGPYLSKGRIAELPRSVGPGPVSLVMKEVISKLIQTAYKSSRVLRELQLEGRSDPSMTQHMLKAKYKGKSYRAVVEICRSVSQLDEFCRNLCIKLECCPNLVSPYLITGDCTENCSQLTKTRYTYYYGKRKKKIGRPPGGHSNLENGQRKPGKRKKRKKIGLMAKRSSRPTVEEPADNMEDDKASVCSDTRTVDSTSTTGSKERGESCKPRSNSAIKRRYTHHIPPPSEIRTRGAKLPKYSFEKRTHKKIMIVEAEQRAMGSRKGMARSSHLCQDGLGLQESSFSCMKPEMPVSLKSETPLKLEKNPLDWTVSDVGDFLMTTDCSDRDLLARLKTEEIDGQALLLLTLPSVQEYMGIKLGPAIKLCHLIERIKLAFYSHFAK